MSEGEEDLFPGEAAAAGRDSSNPFAPASGVPHTCLVQGEHSCAFLPRDVKLAKSTPSFLSTSPLRVPPTAHQTPVLRAGAAHWQEPRGCDQGSGKGHMAGSGARGALEGAGWREALLSPHG